MRFGAAFWVQRTDWPSLRDAVLEAEAAGFDSIWIDDHLLCDEGDWTSGKLEGWGVASALAPLTRTATIGHLVVANTFRNPGITAKQAATLDHLSGVTLERHHLTPEAVHAGEQAMAERFLIEVTDLAMNVDRLAGQCRLPHPGRRGPGREHSYT